MLRAGRCASGAESQGKRKSAATRCLFLLLLHVPLYPELLEFDRMPSPEVKPLRQKGIWEQKVSRHLFEYLFYCLFSKYVGGESWTLPVRNSLPNRLHPLHVSPGSSICFFYFLLQTPIFRSFFRDVIPPPHSSAAVNLLTTEPRRLQDAREEEPTPREGRITAQSVRVRPFPHSPRFDGR